MPTRRRHACRPMVQDEDEEDEITLDGLVYDGRYIVERELGRGGMGVVYLARDLGLDRPVALKVLRPQFSSPEYQERLRAEARALASVRNPHVVQVYAFGNQGENTFIVMEFVKGRSLDEIIARHAEHSIHVPLLRATTILEQIASGLSAVHEAGLVHRDVKPLNIIIEEDTGRPVLVDFGLAARAQAATTHGGSPQYMAPEQTHGEYSARSDVYAFGCTAFELLTGQLPFSGTDSSEQLVKHHYAPPPLASSIRAELSPFDNVIARALAKDPVDRFADCRAFASELRTATDTWRENDPSLYRRVSPSSYPPVYSDDVVRVLVVDDDAAFRRFAEQAAKLALYRVNTEIMSVGSGQSAIDSVRAHRPNLLLLDYEMPGLRGVDTLSAIRALPGGDTIRVVVVSGRAGPEERWRFSVLGVNDFVTKPVDLRAFVDVLAGVATRAGWKDKKVAISPPPQSGG